MSAQHVLDRNRREREDNNTKRKRRREGVYMRSCQP